LTTRTSTACGNFDDFRFLAPEDEPGARNEAATTLSQGTTDLLKLVDPRRDAVAGNWKWDGKTLIAADRPADRLEIPFKVPAEYRLTAVASCRAHREDLLLGLVARSKQVLAILDGWTRATTCLHLIDGQGVPEEDGSVHRGPVLRDGEPNVIICGVRANRISVNCNGARVIDWTGDFDRLSVDAGWMVKSDRHLFIGSWQKHFEISRFELTPL
jgi:hypothetical protein